MSTWQYENSPFLFFKPLRNIKVGKIDMEPKCSHQYSNTHKMDTNVGSPIWQCIKCGKKTSSM